MNAINLDPLRYLPYEVWVKCIRFYAREKSVGALPLVAVSLNWQSHLLETQELWDTIYLDGGHDELCRAECFFHLSRKLPIELVLDSRSNAVDLIIKYKDRIDSLIFYTRDLSEFFPRNDILRHAKRLDGHQYPGLSHIYVEPPCEIFVLIPHSLINACPALIGIHGAYAGGETVSILPASIKNVGVYTSKALPEGLGDRLEIFRVRQFLSNKQEVGRFRYFTTPSIRLTSFELDYGISKTSHNGHGSHFSDSLQYLPLLEGFTSTIHHGLKVLSIAMPWYEISRLVPVISTSPALRELELIVDPAMDPPQPRDIPPLTINEIGHIRKLSLRIHPGASNRIHLFGPNLRRFLKLFIDGNALGHLEELHLESFWYGDRETPNSEVLGLLQVTRNLAELHLIGTRLTSMEPTGILLSSLHTLVGALSIMRYLETPNLARLIDNDPFGISYDSQTLSSSAETPEGVTVHSEETLEVVAVPVSLFYQWNDAVSKAKSNTFPQLITLMLLRSEAYLKPAVAPNFSNLQSITFEDSVYFSPKSGMMGRHLNHFILEMLLSPAICPRLHTVRATVYPNWALTIAMFHRRNSPRTVTPIHSFWLPGYPQIAISRLICQALDTHTEDGGVSMDTASRADTTISLRWELDFFRRQACPICIASGYVACPPDHNAPARKEPPSDPTIRDLLDLDTVMTSAIKFETFTRHHWEAYLEKHIAPEDSTSMPMSTTPHNPKFKKPCDRHHPKDLVRLGPHTLAGTTYDLF